MMEVGSLLHKGILAESLGNNRQAITAGLYLFRLLLPLDKDELSGYEDLSRYSNLNKYET